jgi:hypothetical protein
VWSSLRQISAERKARRDAFGGDKNVEAPDTKAMFERVTGVFFSRLKKSFWFASLEIWTPATKEDYPHEY